MADGPLSPAARPSAPGEFPSTVQVDLRPLATSELIDRGFALYRAHFVGFFLFALLAQTAPLLSQILITATRLNPAQSEFLDSPASFLTRMGLMLLISLAAQVIVFGFEVAVTFYIA